MPVQTRSQQRQQSNPLDATILTLLPEHNNTPNRMVADMFHKYSFLECLPSAIHNLYKHSQCHTEAYALTNPQWVLMPLDEVVQRYTQRTTRNAQCQNIDFATLYDGMGYYVACCYCIRTKQLYYRHDGGGNLYEVEHNCNFASSDFIPSETQSVDVQQWMQDVEKCRSVHELNVVYAP